MKAPGAVLVLLLALAFAGCGGDGGGGAGSKSPIPVATPTASATPTVAVPSPSPTATATATPVGGDIFDFRRATTLSNGLAFIDIQIGNGSRPRPDQVVAVRYTARVAATGEIFDSTAGGSPVSLQLTRVMRGLAEGIVTMREGGTRLLYIPAPLAYGDDPPADSGVPPGAPLIFEVELVSVK